MTRRLIILAVAAVCAPALPAATLQRLSLRDMILKSTTIVRGTIQPGSATALRGPIIYTHFQLSVTTGFKGQAGLIQGQVIDVAVPGGVFNGIMQPVAGAPTLASGQDCVFFLWTSRGGLTQVIGLSQGLFAVFTNAQGQLMVSRGASSSPMLDSSGQPVIDTKLEMPLSQLISTIQTVLAGGGGQ